MKIQKKLLFLLCITSISMSYGMEEQQLKQKIEFYTPYFAENKKTIKEITSKSAVSYNGTLILICKDHPLKPELCKAIGNLPMDTVLTTDNQSYNFINTQPIVDLIDHYTFWRNAKAFTLGAATVISMVAIYNYAKHQPK